ncbi:MAG: c-type cytochrome [Nitrospirales bacterium]|nr:c-type cytochrome [Nitrospirales bacterium]
MNAPEVQQSTMSRPLEKKAISLEHVPLATGDEPVEKLFVQAGCPVCHTIPGIPGAQGRQGPILVLGSTAHERLADANYQGQATTEREYILESVLNPGAYVVPGYPDRVMPRWYGQKLSAKALDKIADYLEQVMDPV